MIIALVFAGLPTTRTLTVFLATLLRTAPCALNILPLAERRSFRSIPGPLGLAPTITATSASLKATYGDDVTISDVSRGNDPSVSYILRP